MKNHNRRTYNVFFNTHTVSGITISVALFVCFLAGAFALFMDNIDNWEGNIKNSGHHRNIDYERVLEVTKNEGYVLDDRTISIRNVKGKEPYISVFANAAPKQVLDSIVVEEVSSEPNSFATANISLRIDPNTYKIIKKDADFTIESVGNFLYQLHYFNQVPYFGFYVSALVSLFFLFAIVTGTIVHWKKIISNFFTFRLRSSLKNLWTDAHTALGIIGLPFQFMYALTGAFFGLSLLIFLPTVALIYDSNQNAMVQDIFPGRIANYEALNVPTQQRSNINNLVSATLDHFGKDDLDNLNVSISAYNDKNAHLSINVSKHKLNNINSMGYRTYRLSDGILVESKEIGKNTFNEGFLLTFFNLHFASFGGYFLKIIYFVLALITCFVILSGVMVWLEARNSKKYAHKQRFITNVGAIYLGASLGLFPAIALFFCITKVFPLEMENRFGHMSTVFFLFWLGYTVYAFFLKNFHKINKHALLLAGVFGILIPILNGLQSGLWPWKSLSQGYSDSFFVDVSWLFIGSICLWVGLKVKRLVAHKKKNPKKHAQTKLDVAN
ncbi:MAG: PepSY-associated TM helix domain-containing protein [Bacteroidota bacterium]